MLNLIRFMSMTFVAITISAFGTSVLSANDVKTNDQLAEWICETRTQQDCKDAKNFMKVIVNCKAAQRMRKNLSGTAVLVGEVQVHFSKKTKVIYVQFEDHGTSTYEKSQTTYTRNSSFSSWKKN